MGLISIVVRTIPTRGKLLMRALQSIAEQTYSQIEAIVVEDGAGGASSATVDQIRQAYPTLSVRYIPIIKSGRSAAANIGLKHATGDFIGFLDDDDFFEPSHCETLLKLLTNFPDAAGAYAAATAIYADLNSSTGLFDVPRKQEVHYSLCGSTGELLNRNLFPLQAVLFRAASRSPQDMFDENLDALEDWLFWTRLFLGKQIVSTARITSSYHLPADEEVARARRGSHLEAERYFNIQREAICEARRMTDLRFANFTTQSRLILACASPSGGREQNTPAASSFATKSNMETEAQSRLREALDAPFTLELSTCRRSKAVAFTSINLKYLPKALVLAKSLKQYNPNCEFHILLNDALPPGAKDWPNVDVAFPVSALGIDNFHSWAFKHNVVELCTATKPFYFRKLMEAGWRKIFYFDPDIKMFGSIDGLSSRLDECDALLTPHCTEEGISEADIHYNEVSSLAHGVFNLGFFGVRGGPNGRRIVDFWCRRMLAHCIDDHARGLFTDQKWFNLLPALFDNVHILRDRAFNVASWNISTRPITKRGSQYLAGGEPLIFFHFSGYDKDVPRRMFEVFGRYNDGINEIIGDYDQEVSKFSDFPEARLPWALEEFDNGEAIKGSDRTWFRDHYEFQMAFRKPFFSSGHASYYSWLSGGGRSRIATEQPPRKYLLRYY